MVSQSEVVGEEVVLCCVLIWGLEQAWQPLTVQLRMTWEPPPKLEDDRPCSWGLGASETTAAVAMPSSLCARTGLTYNDSRTSASL